MAFQQVVSVALLAVLLTNNAAVTNAACSDVIDTWRVRFSAVEGGSETVLYLGTVGDLGTAAPPSTCLNVGVALSSLLLLFFSDC